MGELNIEISTGVHPDSEFKNFKFEFVNWMEMTFNTRESDTPTSAPVPVLNIKEGSVTTARLFHTEIVNAVKWYNDDGTTKNMPDYNEPVERITTNDIEIVDVPDDFKNNIDISVGNYSHDEISVGSYTRTRYYVDITLSVNSGGDLNPAKVGASFKLKVRNKYGCYRQRQVYLQYSYLREAYVYNIDSSVYEKFYSYTYDVSVDGTVVTRNREELWPENFYLPCAYFGTKYYINPSGETIGTKEPDFKFVYRSYPWRNDTTIVDYIKEKVKDVSIMNVSDNESFNNIAFVPSMLPQTSTNEEMEMINYDYVAGTILYLKEEGESDSS